MAFRFQNKKIFILSPEKWGVMRFSKHHYALELAKLNNQVYFINPPDLSVNGIQIENAEETDNLKIVSYKPVYRAKKYLPGWAFRILLKVQAKQLVKASGGAPDVVWCFDPYRFENLNWFGAKTKIFFLADLLALDYTPGEAKTADFSLALSESRIKQLKGDGSPVYFINHGLSSYYTEKASARLHELANGSFTLPEVVTVGYVGNLLMEAPDRSTMRKVIAANPDVRFIFWGQFEKTGQLVAFNNPEVFEFVEFLKSQPHVTLRGPVHPEQLSNEIRNVDMLWVCWNVTASKFWDGSNPHKILEYLSTGKPLVTHFMDVYKNNDLVDMVKSDSNSSFPELFNQVVTRVKNGEDKSVQEKRIKFALDNSYTNQIRRVEDIINGKVQPA